MLFQEIERRHGVNLNQRHFFRSELIEHELRISTFACGRISTHQILIWIFQTQQVRHILQLFCRRFFEHVQRVSSARV